MNELRFGPAGVPIGSPKRATIDGIQYCSKIGLEAMEMEFVQGVRMKKETAEEIKKTAQKLDIKLSSHAPYFVNLCSKEPDKIKNSHRHIFESAQATFWCGGYLTVFHPGYYQDLSPKEAYEIAKKNLIEINEKLRQGGIKGVWLGAETVGKKSQFGGFSEVIKLAQDLDFLTPVLDFGHLHARRDFEIKGEEEYRKIFSTLEKELGDYVKRVHCHFEEINYTEKGERNHLPLETNNEPPFKPFVKVLAENGYGGVIISESPQLEFDALKLKNAYKEVIKCL